MLTREDLLERLDMAEPTCPAETEALLDRAIKEILKNGNKSGFSSVLPSASKKNPWQAKPCVKANKGYVNLGLFPTREDAAKAIIIWMYGGGFCREVRHYSEDRNDRGAGRRKRDRSNHGQGAEPWSQPSHSFRSRCFSLCSQVVWIYVPSSTASRRPRRRCLGRRAANQRLVVRRPAQPPCLCFSGSMVMKRKWSGRAE
jgi:hypothetical protein